MVANLAKMAGAPKDIGAGAYLYFKRWQQVKKGDKRLDIYTSQDYKMEYIKKLLLEKDAFVIGSDKDMTVEVV